MRERLIKFVLLKCYAEFHNKKLEIAFVICALSIIIIAYVFCVDEDLCRVGLIPQRFMPKSDHFIAEAEF